MSNLLVYATLSKLTYVYDFSFILEAWTEICPPYRVSIKDNTCAIAPNLYHNANTETKFPHSKMVVMLAYSSYTFFHAAFLALCSTL